MRIARGFTLIEVMIAAAIAAVLAAAAFASLSTVQRITGASARAAGITAEARVGLEIMGRDIRGAGDSLDQGIAPCLPGVQMNADGVNPCPAILEPHPWRITIARYAWDDTVLGNSDGSTFSAQDVPRLQAGAALNGVMPEDAQNVVSYEFVPDNPAGGMVAATDYSASRPGVAAAQARNVWFGRIDRVQNPFRFGAPPGNVTTRSVLVDNVFLDEALVTAAVGDPPVPDPNAAHSLFTYQVAYRPGELDTGLAARASVTNTLISPPLRFFPIGPPMDLALIPAVAPTPYAGLGYAPQFVGFNRDGTPRARLLTVDPGGSPAQLEDPRSQVRYLIDRNRFRAVRVTFKVHEGRDPVTRLPVEDPGYRLGLDVDNNPANGTARFAAFQATFQIKTLGTNALQYEAGGAM